MEKAAKSLIHFVIIKILEDKVFSKKGRTLCLVQFDIEKPPPQVPQCLNEWASMRLSNDNLILNSRKSIKRWSSWQVKDSDSLFSVLCSCFGWISLLSQQRTFKNNAPGLAVYQNSLSREHIYWKFPMNSKNWCRSWRICIKAIKMIMSRLKKRRNLSNLKLNSQTLLPSPKPL